jgi:hypothetical protein
MWHAAFERIAYGRVPVVVVLHGAVVGGGLELASACHIRVAEPSAFYALPEGSRGLFVGGGGSARISRLIGVARDDRPDADRPRAVGRGRPCGRHQPVPGGGGRRPGQGDGAGRAHRLECADDQLSA